MIKYLIFAGLLAGLLAGGYLYHQNTVLTEEAKQNEVEQAITKIIVDDHNEEIKKFEVKQIRIFDAVKKKDYKLDDNSSAVGVHVISF